MAIAPVGACTVCASMAFARCRVCGDPVCDMTCAEYHKADHPSPTSASKIRKEVKHMERDRQTTANDQGVTDPADEQPGTDQPEAPQQDGTEAEQ